MGLRISQASSGGVDLTKAYFSVRLDKDELDCWMTSWAWVALVVGAFVIFWKHHLAVDASYQPLILWVLRACARS